MEATLLFSFHSSYNYTIGLVGHTVPCGDDKDKQTAAICQTASNGHSYTIAKKEGEVTLQLIGGKVLVHTVYMYM